MSIGTPFLGVFSSLILKDCFQYRQDDNRNILHTSRLLGSIGNRYILFFACNAFVLWILTVCCNDSHARKVFVECDEIMAIFSLFSLFLWCFVIILIVMGIEDQCLGQFLAKVDLTHLFFATKVCCSQVDVHFSDTPEETKDSIWPILHCPKNLQTDR